MSILMMATFGEYVREVREAKGWSITRCAGIASMSPQQWGNYENDRSRRSDGKPSRPSYETCERIAKALGEPASVVVRAAGFAPTELTYEETLDDLPPELQRVWGLHGKVAKALAPGRERDAYIKRLEAEAEFEIARIEERLQREEEARKKE